MANIANSAAEISGKRVLTKESDEEITGLKSFARSPDAPFQVESGSASVSNLDADRLDGEEGVDFHNASLLASGTIPAARIPDPLPAKDGAALTNLNAQALTGIIPNGCIPDPLPAVSGLNLTAMPTTLPATSLANATNIPAGQLTGNVASARLPKTSKYEAGGWQQGNNSTVETDAATLTVDANEVPASGDGVDIFFAGGNAATTNARYMRLYIGGSAALVLINGLTNPSYRWFGELHISRDGSTSARVSGYVMWIPSQGGTPTVYAWGGASITGINWANSQVVKITLQATANNDITLTDGRAAIRVAT